jgi:hypothetical protein
MNSPELRDFLSWLRTDNPKLYDELENEANAYVSNTRRGAGA